MAENELILSMLNAASSLQKLNEKLDCISLHSSPAQSPRIQQLSTQRERVGDHQWHVDNIEASPLFERGSLSGLDDSTSESRGNSLLRLSHTSSKFDSAFGSQTDEESGSIQSTGQESNTQKYRHSYNQSSSRLSTHSQLTRSPHRQLGSGQSQKRRRKRRHHHRRDHSTNQDISSPDTTPDFEHKYSGISRKSLASTSNQSSKGSEIDSASFVHPAAIEHLKRTDSVRSLSSNVSNASTQSTSSRILSIELSTDDLRGMASKTRVHTKTRPKIVKDSHSPAVKQDTKLQEISTEIHEPCSDVETGNSGASTPVVSKRYQLDIGEVFLHRELNKAKEVVTRQTAEPPLTPEIIVINRGNSKEERKHLKSRRVVKEDRERKEGISPLKTKKRVTIVAANTSTSSTQQPPMGTVFYQESLTPQPSPRHQLPHHQLPRRYETSPLGHNETDSTRRRANAPKRRMSILQRLRRRRGSFKKEKKHRERHIPVKRSFSDRMTYDIRKGWIDYEEDLEFISNPSRLRRVGRMIARKADTLHIVQLNRPPSGLYGIYISQTDTRPGIFISRFADSNAAKFYSGLLSPGDEIIRVNKEEVKDKSVDYVYDLLEKLDSVIFSIVPVCSRPDW